MQIFTNEFKKAIKDTANGITTTAKVKSSKAGISLLGGIIKGSQKLQKSITDNCKETKLITQNN